MLAPTDYEIIEAKNGEEALATIAKQRPDLISDGCSTDHGWLHRNAPDKSRSRVRSIPIIAVREPNVAKAAGREPYSPRELLAKNPSASVVERQSFAAAHESAFGTKRTSSSGWAMSAFGGKADMARTHSNVCF
jgi:hypothetical protein